MIKVPLPQVVKSNKGNTEYSQQNQYQEPTRYTYMRFSTKPVDLSIQSGCICENQPTAGV